MPDQSDLSTLLQRAPSPHPLLLFQLQPPMSQMTALYAYCGAITRQNMHRVRTCGLIEVAPRPATACQCLNQYNRSGYLHSEVKLLQLFCPSVSRLKVHCWSTGAPAWAARAGILFGLLGPEPGHALPCPRGIPHIRLLVEFVQQSVTIYEFLSKQQLLPASFPMHAVSRAFGSVPQMSASTATANSTTRATRVCMMLRAKSIGTECQMIRTPIGIRSTHFFRLV